MHLELGQLADSQLCIVYLQRGDSAKTRPTQVRLRILNKPASVERGRPCSCVSGRLTGPYSRTSGSIARIGPAASPVQRSVTVTLVIETGSRGRSFAPVGPAAMASTTSMPFIT